MLREQVNVAWIELLGFVEVGLALVPIAAPSLDVRQRLRNLTVVRQKPICLLEIIDRSVVVLQAGIVIKALGEYGLAKIGLKSQCGFGCLPRFFAKDGGWL